MNNKDVISAVSQRLGYTQDDTRKLVDTLVGAMSDAFQDNTSVSVPNFGVFEVKKRMERIVVNPSTRQRMLVPPKLVLSFRPNASIKEKLKNGGMEDE